MATHLIKSKKYDFKSKKNGGDYTVKSVYFCGDKSRNYSISSVYIPHIDCAKCLIKLKEHLKIKRGE